MRTGARVTLSMAAVVVLTGGCAALDRFQHATTLTFRVDTMECGPIKATSSVCQFFAYYGNVSKHPIQVDPASTRVVDRKGNVLQPVAEQGTGDAFLLKPGLQHGVSWSVTLPATAKPARVTWHGTSVPVLLDSAPLPSASTAPSASAVPSTTPPPATSAGSSASAAAKPSPTPAPTTTVKPTTHKAKPTTHKAKPTTAKPTTTRPAAPRTTAAPPTTPPPPVHTTTSRPRPTTRHTTPPTTNPTNPGGGSGGIG